MFDTVKFHGLKTQRLTNPREWPPHSSPIVSVSASSSQIFALHVRHHIQSKCIALIVRMFVCFYFPGLELGLLIGF